MPRTRRQKKNDEVLELSSPPKRSHNDVHDNDNDNEDDDDDEDDNASDDEETQVYSFNGVVYDDYETMVAAKRQRNREMLVSTGLAKAMEDVKQSHRQSRRGLSASNSRKRKSPAVALPRRSSNRIAGVKAEEHYVDYEGGGKITIAGGGAPPVKDEPRHFKNRINDGSDLSIKGAMELCEDRWIKEDSIESAESFMKELQTKVRKEAKQNHHQQQHQQQHSPTSVASKGLTARIEALSADDETNVAKVLPDRVFSIACHPSSSSLIVGAGDKTGHVGLWNVDSPHSENNNNDGVHLFHLHSAPVCCLEWSPTGSSLLSASYDGTVRVLDVESQTFTEIFATYDNDDAFQGKLGRGLLPGDKSYTQYVTLDHRFNTERCFFTASSDGDAVHIDLRAKGLITFHEDLSEKKINTLSLHRNGYTLASAGLDRSLKIWDVRKFGDSRRPRKGTNRAPRMITQHHVGKSINSALFSQSGSTLATATMADTLDFYKNIHLEKAKTTAPELSIEHDNQTGRWLTTFMASWHPNMELLVCGSMRRPRRMELFDDEGNLLRGVEGDALSSVVSRCCFHPSPDKVIAAGGNSSGRVILIR